MKPDLGVNNGYRAGLGSEKGYSLIEVLAAVALIGVVLIPLMTLFTAGLDSAADAYYRTVAINLAQAKVDELRAIPLSSVQSEPRAPVDPSDYPDFEREVLVEVQSADLKKVTVTVNYRVKGRHARAVQLVTLMAGGR